MPDDHGPSADVLRLMIEQNAKTIEDLKEAHKALDKKVMGLELFKLWVMGIGVTVAALVSFFADQVKDLIFHIPQ